MKNIAKTKIIATIGPSSWNKDVLKDMFKNGMQIARINASFADKEEIQRVANTLRNISPRIAIMLDSQGTKIRVVGLEKAIEIKEKVSISSSNQDAPNSIKISYPDLHKNITRNGYMPARQILTGMGPLDIKQPRVDDRSLKSCPVCQRFTSSILPRYLRRIPSIDNLIPALYLKGISTNDFTTALTAILGQKASGLSFNKYSSP